MLTTLLIGNALKITATFTEDGAPVDPLAVRVRLRSPAGGETVLTPAPVDGAVSVEWEPPEPGVWHVRVESDNPESSAEDSIRVGGSRFTAPA